MHDEITKGLQENEVTCVLYLDLKKAFDTVCKDILLKKMKHMGISGTCYKLLSSYLDSRCQITKINDVYSKKEDIVNGCSSGVDFGSFIYLYYI